MTDRLGALAAAVDGDPQTLRFLRAPGRVNLMGDHTDYNDGLVLPLAIDRDCLVAYRSTDTGRVRVRSSELEGVVDVQTDGSTDPATVEPRWGRFIAGAAAAVAEQGCRLPGFEAVLSSTVPAGAGLSSSSALAVALVLAMTDSAGFRSPEPAEAARTALDAEVRATGVPGGLMDQLTSLLGRAGCALRIDCRSLTTEPVPIPADLTVLVVHSGRARTVAGSEYAARRAECEAAAARIGVPALRDASLDQVRDDPIARHVVTENQRVVETEAALRSDDRAALTRLLLASHASLRDDYRVSTPELDLLVDALVAAGSFGARLTGAGFGGCVVALTSDADAERIASDATSSYRRSTGLEPRAFPVRAVDGAGPITHP
ncbi:MAG: galactokinase [Acidimicrobiia bacterium]